MKKFLISVFISAVFINIFIISGCKKSSHSVPSPAPTMAVNFVTQWGSSGSDAGYFNTPVGVAVDVTGNVYVADEANNRIQKFSGSGIYMTQFGGVPTPTGTGSGNLNGQLNTPVGVAVDVTGNVYVADWGNNRIQEFSSSGIYMAQFGGPGGSGSGNLNHPSAAAISNSGNAYVADTGNFIIQEFNSTYTYVTQWPSTPLVAGTGDGQFSSPVGVAIDSASNVYVTDFYNNNVQVFSSSGAYMTQWGSSYTNPGNGDGQFCGPYGIAIDSSGNVYVVDQGNYRVEEFSSTGKCLKQWGGYGNGEYQFILPSGIAVDSNGNIFVVDSGTNKVKKFASLP
jgi:sugar lactone lactonase YvrE